MDTIALNHVDAHNADHGDHDDGDVDYHGEVDDDDDVQWSLTMGTSQWESTPSRIEVEMTKILIFKWHSNLKNLYLH